MKKLLIAVLVSMPLVACTEETIIKKGAPTTEGSTTEPTPGQDMDGMEPAAPAPTGTGTTAPPPPSGPTASADKCLDGQDMDGADVNVSTCPAIPELPEDAPMGNVKVSLGAWEIGTTADGETYKYGELSAPGMTTRTLTYDGGSTAVNAQNLECWAKGYYRLRKILQNAPAEYVALKNAGFQFRFFQFQTDLRNGATGYKAISSFQDHLVKWVTVISAAGVCQQPTLTKFRDYAKSELTRRGLPLPGTN